MNIILGNPHPVFHIWVTCVMKLRNYLGSWHSTKRCQALLYKAMQICIFLFLFLIILYGIVSLALTKTTQTVTSTTSACGYPNWQGDKVCDDMNNNADCDYDGGDCCGDFVDKSHCRLCQCLDPTHTTPSTTTFATSDTSTLKSTSQTSNTQSTLASSSQAATTTVPVSTSSNASNTTPQSTIQTSSTLSTTTTMASTTSVTTCGAEHPSSTSGKIL